MMIPSSFCSFFGLLDLKWTPRGLNCRWCEINRRDGVTSFPQQKMNKRIITTRQGTKDMFGLFVLIIQIVR
jgi:hypothetical protein